ncbi:hypothetical protein [Parafrankia discariae]|uniref:hypothetical protein n=1 Tax=Parafrankia discariae TaxID=365528 RepID=UPI00036CD6BA|nr:hypothetical protein [Parafrankia discariae]
MPRTRARYTRGGGAWRLVAALAAWWLWIPLAVFVWWAFISLFLAGIGPLHLGLWSWLDSWYAVDSGQRWLYVLIGAVGSAVLTGVYREDAPGMSTVIAVLAVALAATAVVMFVRAVWDNDKDLGRFYSAATTIVVPDVDEPPAGVAVLLDGNPVGDGDRCDLLEPAGDDVPVCIREGTLPSDGWEPRLGSLDGARFVMTRSSGGAGNVSLMEDTLTYLNGGDGNDGGPRWSGIRDGAGRATPLDGVVEWTGGTEAPTECRFSGDHRIDRAFAGELGNSLPNLLNDRFPRLFFEIDDAWGYCRGTEPVIVLPVQEQIHYKHRTVMTTGGIVIVRGSPSGGAILEHRRSVRPGELPGPVYPDSLVEAQRDSVRWAGGRGLMDRANFGFVPGDSTNQEGNHADYLLRSVDDGRLYWVTPAAPRASDSQRFVAYELVPADTVNAGELNPLSVFVLDDDDRRIVNIDQLVAAAVEYLARADPGLVSSGGKIVEFLPLHDDVWQGYVEINGRVVYRISISYSNRIPTELVALAARGTPTPPSGGGTATPAPERTQPPADQCGRPPGQLSAGQLAACIQAFADELASRAPAATATG